MNETSYVMIETFAYNNLVREAHDAALLKNMLVEKQKKYGGIKHEELELICKMFVLDEEDE